MVFDKIVKSLKFPKKNLKEKSIKKALSCETKRFVLLKKWSLQNFYNSTIKDLRCCFVSGLCQDYKYLSKTAAISFMISAFRSMLFP